MDLVLVKKDMLRYVQDVRAVRGRGQSFTYHHVVLRKCQKNEVVNGTTKTRCEKLRNNSIWKGMIHILGVRE